MRAELDLPDTLAAEADRMAAEMGLSRQEFYERAVAAVVRRNRRRASVTDLMNQAWGRLSEEERKEELAPLAPQAAILKKEDW